MIIRRNVLSAEKVPARAHNGNGKIQFCRPFEADDFETKISFIDYVVIPPGASIGNHRHSDNEEVYFIAEGSGTMTTNGESYTVKAGDLIVNRRGWSHGLLNDTESDTRILVWEVAY